MERNFGGNEENFELEKSPLKVAYELVGATGPKQLHLLYSKIDQDLMRSNEWDYQNPDLIVNKVREILESVEPEQLTKEEQKWRKEILWFWYHHAISSAIVYGEKEDAKKFAEIALSLQDDDHPNQITRLLFLLLNDRLQEAEDLANNIPRTVLDDGLPNPEPETAQELIEAYKKGKFEK